jgi:hypothetical protein
MLDDKMTSAGIIDRKNSISFKNKSSDLSGTLVNTCTVHTSSLDRTR